MGGGLDTVWVAVDEKAQDELTRFSVARNEAAVKQMMEQGRVLVCPRRTKVAVVETRLATSTVRFLEGTYNGRTGVVPNEYLHK
jgi:hypothetical protein